VTAAPPVVAGIDVATGAVRVLCVDGEGRIAAAGGAELPAPVRGPDGRSEQDAGTWWPAVARALRQATGALPGRGREVEAVAVSATSGTIVLADREGRPIGPAMMYDDRRAADLNAVAQDAGAARWAALGMAVGPTAALGRVGWLASHTDRREPGFRLLHTPDLVGWRLTGAPLATDWSHALKTGYDPLTGEWAAESFDALGVPEPWLPPVRPPATAVGTVCQGAADETGLPEGCEVRLGMTDGCAGQLACGAVRPGQFVGVLGTTYVMKGVSRELVTDPSGALYSHRHPDGWWLPGGASNTGGEAVSPPRFAGGAPSVLRDRLAALDAAAAGRGPASVVAYPLRRDGERFPFVSGAARGWTLGEPVDDADRHRAALEGVAFVERLALERAEALGLKVQGPLSAAGGGSRSEVWNRIRATALGRPLRIVEHAETAFGAALLAATGTLHRDLAEAAGAMVRPGRLVGPVDRERPALEESYGTFTAELRRLGWL
jgi:sugar (pentulose or hexulose) kinase